MKIKLMVFILYEYWVIWNMLDIVTIFITFQIYELYY